MCDCGKRIENVIKRVKESQCYLKHLHDNEPESTEWIKLQRWWLKADKWWRKSLELNHRFGCLGETYLINEMTEHDKNIPK